MRATSHARVDGRAEVSVNPIYSRTVRNWAASSCENSLELGKRGPSWCFSV